MKTKNLMTIILSLAMILPLLTACRKDVSEPSPVGPSTLAALLKVWAAPNVIAAGNTRSTTTIQATLQWWNGTVREGKTIYFEITNAAGSKVNIGYFEGQQSVVSKVTDAGGTASVVYYGPLSTEVSESDTEVYIWAKTALEGSEFVFDNTPIHIIPNMTKATLVANAYPNVLFATNTRPESVIKAVARSGTNAIANRKVFFDVDSYIPGYFEGNKKTTYVLTNSAGEAEIIFYGARKDELGSGDIHFYITVRLETNSPESPPDESLYTKVFMKVVKER
jgi:hypothetical protein